MFGEEQCSFPTTGRAQVEAFTRERPKIIAAAFGVGTTNSRNPLEIITTDCESLTESLNPLQAIHPVSFRVPLVIEITEIYKVTFEYPVKLVSATGNILFRRRIFCGNCGGHMYYYCDRSYVS